MNVLRTIGAILRTKRKPSRRAVAAFAKLNGVKLGQRWPFINKADPALLNLGFEDVLEFQYARSRIFRVLVVGAYDGVENDPLSKFVTTRECSGVFIEPQPAVFARLQQNLGKSPAFQFLNAAVDRATGMREFFQIQDGVPGFPPWTGQLASFSKDHIAKHEHKVPGLSNHITSRIVDTISFQDLLAKFRIRSLDVLQIDAEGIDAQLLGWFPFDTVKPGVVHYEVAHMSAAELNTTRARLKAYGYRLYPADSAMDEMAVLV